MRNSIIVSVLSILILISNGHAQQFTIAKDDPIIAQMDSLDVLNFFKHNNFTYDKDKLNIYNYPSDSVPTATDDLYKERMRKIDNASPFKLDYNDVVRQFIELYVVRRRGTVSKMLGLAELYFPMFEQKLNKHKMPLELKYLAIVESALNPSARSRVGASGLWQFMYATGKMYNLNTTSYIDERCDPEKSTDAACAYLKYLYNYFDQDWQLALAAYNCGPGNVNKAIRRAGGTKNFWELRAYLPKETANYVPSFIAVNYIMAYHKEHNIYPNKPKFFNYEIDSVYVKKMLRFSQISKYLNISIEDIRFLNPQYILDIIPESDYGYPLYLPKNLIGDFMANEKDMYEYIITEVIQPVVADTTTKRIQENNGNKLLEHKVVKGEYLAIISRKYNNVPIDSIKAWNKLNSEVLYVGQILKIYVDEKFNPTSSNTTTTSSNTTNNSTSSNSSSSSSTTKYHTVKKGDTLWGISQKYGTSVDNLKKYNKLYNGKTIYVGMKLIVKK